MASVGCHLPEGIIEPHSSIVGTILFDYYHLAWMICLHCPAPRSPRPEPGWLRFVCLGLTLPFWAKRPNSLRARPGCQPQKIICHLCFLQPALVAVTGAFPEKPLASVPLCQNLIVQLQYDRSHPGPCDPSPPHSPAATPEKLGHFGPCAYFFSVSCAVLLSPLRLPCCLK